MISPEAVHLHTGLHASGYRTRTEYGRGERVSMPFADASIAVDDLIGAHDPT